MQSVFFFKLSQKEHVSSYDKFRDSDGVNSGLFSELNWVILYYLQKTVSGLIFLELSL